jgi:hypothetical protein
MSSIGHREVNITFWHIIGVVVIFVLLVRSWAAPQQSRLHVLDFHLVSRLTLTIRERHRCLRQVGKFKYPAALRADTGLAPISLRLIRTCFLLATL